MDAIRHADGFIDALAGGRPVVPMDAADAELAALLGGWRDEMRWPPATGLISESEAVAALEAGRAQKNGRDRWNTAPDPTSSRRNRRGLGAIGAAAAAVLCIGGFGALVAGAGPGDALYGLRTMMFGAPKQVRDAQVGLAARTELSKVQDLIEQGDWDQAQNKLVAVSTQVASIADEEQKQDLLDQFNDLSAKVVERDPGATAPPGIVYTVPPAASELVPAVAPPTSVPTAPPEATTPTTSTMPSDTGTEPSAPATSEPAPAMTSEPTTATSGADSATSSAEATPQTQQTTTPTSAAPGAAGTPATPAPSTGEVPDAAAQSTAPAGTESRSAEPAATTSPAPQPDSPSPQSPGETAQPQPPAVVTVTTTVVVPAPAA